MLKTIVKVIEVKDNWVNIRATMDTGVAGHVMLAEMFPKVKLDRTEHNKELRCSKWRTDQRLHSIQVRCEALDLNEKGRASWQCRGAGR